MRGVGRRRAVRLRRQVQPAALRELLAEADPEATTRRSTSPAAARSRPGTSASTTTTTTRTCRSTATRPARRCSTATGSGLPSGTRTSRRTGPSFAQIICVADTDAQAEELYAEHILYFFNRCLHVYPGFADPPGLPHGQDDQGRQARPARARRTRRCSRTSPGRTWSRAASSSPAAPTRCREQLEQMIKDLRIGTCSAVPHGRHARLEDPVQHATVRREGHARRSRTSGPSSKPTTAGGAIRLMIGCGPSTRSNQHGPMAAGVDPASLDQGPVGPEGVI